MNFQVGVSICKLTDTAAGSFDINLCQETQ